MMWNELTNIQSSRVWEYVLTNIKPDIISAEVTGIVSIKPAQIWESFLNIISQLNLEGLPLEWIVLEMTIFVSPVAICWIFMTNSRYDYDMVAMESTKALIAMKPDEYPISKRLVEQLMFNHSAKISGLPPRSYKQFYSGEKGYLNQRARFTLANVLSQHPLTRDRYTIIKNTSVIHEKGSSLFHPMADSYMLTVMMEFESNQPRILG